MKLYGVNLSPFSAACRLAIYAKGLEDRIQQAPPPGGGLKSPEYLAINPIGKLPSLETSWGHLPESMTICEYLEDEHPEPSLLPASAEGRARARLLARLVDLYVYPPLAVLFRQANPKDGVSEQAQEGVANLVTAFGYLEHSIGRDGLAVGDQLSLADCALVPSLFFAQAMLPRFGRAQAFAEHPALGGYFGRVAKNPHAARVLAELQQALAERMKATASS